MIDEFFLSPTDVAEALGCSAKDVLCLIENGDLVAHRSRGWRIGHRELARYVQTVQSTSIALGVEPSIHVTFASSRPVDDNVIDS